MPLSNKDWKCKKCGEANGKVHFYIPQGLMCDNCMDKLSELSKD